MYSIKGSKAENRKLKFKIIAFRLLGEMMEMDSGGDWRSERPKYYFLEVQTVWGPNIESPLPSYMSSPEIPSEKEATVSMKRRPSLTHPHTRVRYNFPKNPFCFTPDLMTLIMIDGRTLNCKILWSRCNK